MAETAQSLNCQPFTHTPSVQSPPPPTHTQARVAKIVQRPLTTSLHSAIQSQRLTGQPSTEIHFTPESLDQNVRRQEMVEDEWSVRVDDLESVK